MPAVPAGGGMARTGKEASRGVEEHASEARFVGRAAGPSAPEPDAENGTVDGPPLFTHSSAASTKDKMIDLARLLGRCAARDLMEQAAATACAVDVPNSGHQGEAVR
jgi:hypothetical protein